MSIRFIFVSVLSALTVIGCGRQQEPAPVWEALADGVEFRLIDTCLFGAPQSISILRYDPSLFETRIVYAPSQCSDSTEALALRYGGIAAINGSYYDMQNLTSTTFVKKGGEVMTGTLAREMARVDGILATRDRQVHVFPCITEETGDPCDGFDDAIAGGPVLLSGGRPAMEIWPESDFYTRRHPRSVVGVADDGLVYFVVIDGRHPGLAEGTSISETVLISSMLGLRDAINLDGGGSSTLWTDRNGVLSHPSDNRSFDKYGQRIIPTAIVIKP